MPASALDQRSAERCPLIKTTLAFNQVHLARALKGRGEFQEALDVLDAAEEMSADQGRAIRVYKGTIYK